LKKSIAYIVVVLIIILISVVVLVQKHNRQFDERVVLTRQGKMPYGVFLTYQSLPSFFTNATVEVNKKSPTEWWNEDTVKQKGQLFFLISQQFNPTKYELKRLADFAQNGNNVFICTPVMNRAAVNFFNLNEYNGYNGFDDRTGYYQDTGVEELINPPFNTRQQYFDEGLHFVSYFNNIDTSFFTILGRNKSNDVDFVKINAGAGAIYLHSDPFCFANYFLLYKNNKQYLQQVASLFPANTNKIIWDEYYIYKSNDYSYKAPSPFRILFNYPAFKWALLTLLILLLLYVSLNVKRLQRIIPAKIKPANASLDFAKTVGRLYYDKGDHTNLATKMTVYLLDHIRNKYYIATTDLNDQFKQSIMAKTGYNEEKVNELVSAINYVQQGNAVNEAQLANMYTIYSAFYKHTS
jgi:hypothetical protein